MIAGGVEIFRGAAVAFDEPQRGVAGLGGEQPMGRSCASRCSICWRVGVSTRRRRYDGSPLVRPMRNCSTSKRPLDSTTLSKICSMTWESIRWPSASTTSSNGMKLPVYLRGCAAPCAASEWKTEKTREKQAYWALFRFTSFSAFRMMITNREHEGASEPCKYRGFVHSRDSRNCIQEA